MARRKRDFGSIRQLKSGRYQARYLAPNNEVTPAPFTFSTRSEADDWLADIQVQLRRQMWKDPNCKTSLDVYMRDWIMERNLKVRTRELYDGYRANHIGPFFSGVAVEDLRTADIRRWRAWLRNNGVGEPTIAKCYSVISAVLATAVRDELIVSNPCQLVGARQYDQAARPFVDVDDAMRIAEVIEPRFQLLVLLAVFGQLRLGELAGLTRRDVSLPTAQDPDLVVRVHRGLTQTRSGQLEISTPKSARGKRSVTLPASMVAAVSDHLAMYAEPGPDGAVFVGERGGRLRGQNFNRVWKRTITRAGVDPDLHFHDLRHTGGTLVARAGATIEELMTRLGHVSPKAAMVYQHSTRERDRQIASGLDQFAERFVEREG